jgi:hypothetical protein
MAIRPPWYTTLELPGWGALGGKIGRGFLWSPPQNQTMTRYSRVNGEQLFAEITVIASLTSLAAVGLGIASIRSE